jgi:SAM-dependent methyltransferase
VTSSEFYDRTYGTFADRLNATIRSQAFGEEIGQNSWLTADEHRDFFAWLEIDTSSHVLEVACGSGGPALLMARETGCQVTGVDLHDAGMAAANVSAEDQGLSDRAHFVHADAREPLPFEDGSFTAPGHDEALLQAAGFEGTEVKDVTPNMAAVASAWRGARARHAAELALATGLPCAQALMRPR